MIRRLDSRIWAGASFLLSVGIFFVDAQIPPEIAISPLYLFPVGMVAWHAGRWWAIAMAAVSGAQWIGAEIIAGVTYSSWFVYVWNTVMRCGTFVVVAVLTAGVRQAHDQYRMLSRSDVLTGALNSRAFREGLAQEIERAQRHQRALTIVYIDLDDFKLLNDSLGHTVGDVALSVVGKELIGQTRRSDLVARVGGDEFAVLLVDVAAGLVPDALDRLQTGLLAAMSAARWPVTFSIGAVTFSSTPDSPEAALHAADQVMYAVKRGSKNAIRHKTR